MSFAASLTFLSTNNYGPDGNYCFPKTLQIKPIWIYYTIFEVYEELQSTIFCRFEVQNEIWGWWCFWKKVGVLQKLFSSLHGFIMVDTWEYYADAQGS